MPLREGTSKVSFEHGIRDSVILLLSASKMGRIYLFATSLVSCRRIEAKTCLRLSRIAMFLHRAIQVLLRSVIRAVNNVERKIQNIRILNRK